ncbi:ATP phosphoribosyltransferase regulatory subunit, partial [Brevibacterium paucivorans]
KERNPLGLHFDLTVPTARYVLENAGHLNFPFKRYSIQPVWRGERPQDGRFREFIQADIDVIGDEVLADHFEVEIPLVMVQAFDALRELGVPEAGIVANNRKLLEGFARGLGLDDVTSVLRAIDKLDKIGPEKVEELMSLGVSRLMSRLVGANRALTATRGVPTAVLVAVTAEDQRAEADQIATALRRRGIPVDVSPSADKFGKQIRFAER